MATTLPFTDYKINVLQSALQLRINGNVLANRARNTLHRKGSGKLKCCFTSTEAVGLLGTGFQDVHLDFHTAPVADVYEPRWCGYRSGTRGHLTDPASHTVCSCAYIMLTAVPLSCFEQTEEVSPFDCRLSVVL